jgi:uncharacterized SAM-binding protein YcdF (DUF218 family)
MSRRLVAVLGYSNGGATLHEICSARLRRAETEVKEDDVVLLSGWARRRTSSSEAELMAAAWNGPAARIIVSGDARSTFGNALAAARAARLLHPTEVVVVTSAWHGRRALTLFRAALRSAESTVTLVPSEERGAPRARFRELGCWALVPVQLALVRVLR